MTYTNDTYISKSSTNSCTFNRIGKLHKRLDFNTKSNFIEAPIKMDSSFLNHDIEVDYRPSKISQDSHIKATNKYGMGKYEDTETVFTNIINHFNLKHPNFTDQQMIKYMKEHVFKSFLEYFPHITEYANTATNEDILHALIFDLNGERRDDSSCGIDYPKRQAIHEHYSHDVAYLIDCFRDKTFNYDTRILVKSFLKDELRDKNKDCRGICVPQLPLFLCGFYLGLWIYRYLKEECNNSTAFAVGSVPLDYTYKFMRFNHNENILSTDISGQDKFKSVAFHEFFEEFLKFCLPNEILNIEWFMREEVYERNWVDFYGNVLRINWGEISGGSLTIIKNCFHTAWLNSLESCVYTMKKYMKQVTSSLRILTAPCNATIMCLGDDLLRQSHCKSRDENFVEIAGLMQHALTIESDGPLSETEFLSNKYHKVYNIVVPYYCNLDKAISTLNYMKCDFEDYCQKLSSFKNLLAYAPEGTKYYYLAIAIDNHDKLVRKQANVSTPYINYGYIRNQRHDNIMRCFTVGKEVLKNLVMPNVQSKLNRNPRNPNNTRVVVQTTPVSTGRVKKARAKPTREIVLTTQQQNTRRKSRGKNKGSKPKKKNDIETKTKKYIQTIIDPLTCGRLPSDTGSNTAIWAKEINYTMTFSDPQAEYVAYAWSPNTKSNFMALTRNSGLSGNLAFLDTTTQFNVGASTTQINTMNTAMPLQNGSILVVSPLKPTTNYVPMGEQLGYYRGKFTVTTTAIAELVISHPSVIGVQLIISTVDADGVVMTSYNGTATTTSSVGIAGLLMGNAAVTSINNDFTTNGAFGLVIGFKFTSASNTANAGISLEIAPGALDYSDSYTWKRMPFGYSFDPATGISTRGQSADDLAAYLKSYPSHRVNAFRAVTHTNNSGAGSNGVTQVTRRIPSGEDISLYQDPASLYNLLSQLGAQEQATNKLSVEYLYTRDADRQWEMIPTDAEEIFDPRLFEILSNRFYPVYVTVVKKPLSIVNSDTILPLIISGTYSICLEFKGISTLSQLRLPPLGQADYRSIYATYARQYTDDFGKNSDHMKKALKVAADLARNPAIQRMTLTLLQLGVSLI